MELIPLVELCTRVVNAPYTNAMIIQLAIHGNEFNSSDFKVKDQPFKLLTERPGLPRIVYACMFDDLNKKKLLP